MAVKFFCRNIVFSLHGSNSIKRWLIRCIRNESHRVGEVHFIFTEDKYLLSLNRRYLRHSYPTDVLTFDYSGISEVILKKNYGKRQSGIANSAQQRKKIQGEIYISIERVRKNAVRFKTTFRKELLRVMIHGILHLCGYKDKTVAEKIRMTTKEDYYMGRFPTYYRKKYS